MTFRWPTTSASPVESFKAGPFEDGRRPSQNEACAIAAGTRCYGAVCAGFVSAVQRRKNAPAPVMEFGLFPVPPGAALHRNPTQTTSFKFE